MQVLVHLGLNKCASTYIQAALAAAPPRLRRNGVEYPVEDGRTAQYGLSRHYGFGPNASGVKPRSLPWIAEQAKQHGCERLIISSEFLSVYRPRAIEAFARDLEALGADTRLLFFSRDVRTWVHSLFNQHVKTANGGPYLPSINAYIDHALKQGSVDIAKRYRAWATVFGANRLEHYHLASPHSTGDVLAPFAGFAGVDLPPVQGNQDNRSLSPGALYLIGLIRQAPPSPERKRLLAIVRALDCSWVPVPPGYLEIDAERMARLEEQVIVPFNALPRAELPTRHPA